MEFGVILKIYKKSNFDQNQLKLATQHKTCICIRKYYKNEKFSSFHFWQNLAKIAVL